MKVQMNLRFMENILLNIKQKVLLIAFSKQMSLKLQFTA